jgi:hypothetical protein
MAIETIPVSFVLTCDRCGQRRESNSCDLPMGWAELNLSRTAYEDGTAVGDAGFTKMLCIECADAIVDLVTRAPK